MSIEPEVLRVNESASLDIKISDAGNAEVISVPEVKKLTIKYRGTARKFEFVNGRTWSGLVLQFSVKAGSEGSFTIPPVKIRINGQVQQTPPVTLKVKKALKGTPSEGKAVAFGLVAPSRERVYTGQPLLLRYYLVHRGIDLRDTGRFRKMPAASGAVLEEMDETISHQQITLKGSSFTKTHLATMVLTPVSTGTIRVEGGTFVVESTRPFGFMRVPDNMGVDFDSVAIRALKLPAAGQPAGYHGDVGRFTMKLDGRGQSLKPFQEARFTLSVEGTGSIHTLAPPEIGGDVKDLKVMVGEGATNTIPADDTVKGSREFIYTLIPSAPGEYTVGPVRFSYFHSGKKRYVTETAGPMRLTVTGAPVKKDEERPGDTTGAEKKTGNHVLDIVLAVAGTVVLVGLLLGIIIYIDRRKIRELKQAENAAVKGDHVKEKRAGQVEAEEGMDLRPLLLQLRRSLRGDDTEKFLSQAEKIVTHLEGNEAAELRNEIYSYRYGGVQPANHSLDTLYQKLTRIAEKNKH